MTAERIGGGVADEINHRGPTEARFPFKRNRLRWQAIAFLAVFVYATHATHASQAIAFERLLG